MHFMLSYILLTPIFALKYPIRTWCLQDFLSIDFRSSSLNTSTVSLPWSGAYIYMVCSDVSLVI